ncbi:hypothetical protein [uncultured Chryseobacterium sp.]|uniref:hypothetical protein n=1 Tax=uncultured Chryseobacterium sp. TaxID=259322 RepID=UPI0025D4F324|nr:hypothetical protein [uncultured Chryseobacterium sp.]
MNEMMTWIQKKRILEITLLVLFSVYVWFFFYLSRDTYDYINLANSIKEGRLYYTRNGYSTVWPLGYPVIIALVSLIGLPLKVTLYIINLAVFIVSYKLLAKIIDENGDNDSAAILILCIFSGIYITGISEPLFIGVIITILYIVKNFDYSFRHYSVLAFLFWFLIETKHAGIFLLPCSLLYLNGLKLNKRTFYLLLTISLVAITYIARWYFLGTITGSNRSENKDSLFTVLEGSFTISHYHEFKRKYHVYFFLLLFFLMFALGKYIKTYKKKSSKYILFIFGSAVFYYCFIVALRYSTFFSGLEPRFMAPYILFSMIFVLSIIHSAKNSFIILSVILFGLTVYLNLRDKYDLIYKNDAFTMASFKGKNKINHLILDSRSSLMIANTMFDYKDISIDDRLRSIKIINNNKDSVLYRKGAVFLIKRKDTVKIVDLTLNNNIKK